MCDRNGSQQHGNWTHTRSNIVQLPVADAERVIGREEIEASAPAHRRTCNEIEQRLFRHPAVSDVHAYPVIEGSGGLSDAQYVVAIGVYGWAEDVTAAQIEQWLAKHLSANELAVRIVCRVARR